LKIQKHVVGLPCENDTVLWGNFKTASMNILAYIIYLFITYLITVHVGLVFYKNGRYYILNLLQGDEKLTLFINRLLLVGYYLLNLGYVALTISTWQQVDSWAVLWGTVATMTGKILLTLGLIHFGNMTAIYFIGKYRHTSITHHK
jgi:hypothetical protein